MEVAPVKYQASKDWILKKHYAKRMPSISFAFGLFLEGDLIGIITYGSPASPSLCKGVCGEEYRDRVLELNRLVINSTAPKNSASFLIGKSLKLLPRDKIVVSYADTEQGHVGYVYQATNWIYTGCTKARTDIDTGKKHSRHYEGIKDYSKRKFRSAKHRYVYFTDKSLKKELKYPILGYPKGESKRYNCIDIIQPNNLTLAL